LCRQILEIFELDPINLDSLFAEYAESLSSAMRSMVIILQKDSKKKKKKKNKRKKKESSKFNFSLITQPNFILVFTSHSGEYFASK
jgi:23S rRNA pseudoU1915 N3-methylase RlmH